MAVTNHRQRKSLADQRDRDRELLDTLKRVATERGAKDAPSITPLDVKNRIWDAIENAEDNKLRDWSRRHRRIEERRAAIRKTAMKPTSEWAQKLVRLKANESGIGRRRLRRDKAIENANAGSPQHLSPVERRAVEIVCGKPRRARKNVIETRAIQLVDGVLADWFPERPVRGRGRPTGTSATAVLKGDGSVEYGLTVSNVVAITLPIIEEFAGERIRVRAAVSERTADIEPANFAAVIAAVRAAGLSCPIDLASRLVRRIQASHQVNKALEYQKDLPLRRAN